MQPLRAALAAVLRRLPARERRAAAAALLAERVAAAPGLAWAAALVAAEAQQLQARPAPVEDVFNFLFIYFFVGGQRKQKKVMPSSSRRGPSL